ncbi:right-handed parallel beta-helix repeat-containing protein [Salmonirosea aquatica]
MECSRQKARVPLRISRNYYLSRLGNDAGPGNEELPFRTLAALLKIEFLPGDTLFLRGGDLFTGTLKLTLSGAEKHPVIITSYGQGRATIDGGNRVALEISGSWFKINELIAKGTGRKTGNTTDGVRIVNAHHVTVENLETSGFQKSGIVVSSSAYVTLKSIHAWENGAIGISLYECRDCRILDCLAENNPGDPTNFTNHSGNGILVGESSQVLIDYCVATNNGWDMPRVGNGPVGIWAYQSDSVLIQHCIAYRNKTSRGGKDGGGFDFDGGMTNSVIQYCLSYENEGAGYGLFQYYGARPWHNNTVRYCISINDGLKTQGAGGILVWNGGPTSEEFTNSYVYNNVIYNENRPAIAFDDASSNQNFVFANTIFLGKDEIIAGPTSGERFVGNIWWSIGTSVIRFRGYQSLVDWAKATGQEKLNGHMAGLQINPRLKGLTLTTLTDPHQLATLTGFQLQPTSPLRNKGLDLRKWFGRELPKNDFYGNPIPLGTGLEPGIFEYPE